MTASAAEVVTLSLMPFPYVTYVGEPTKGMSSDLLERRLPNGWTFDLANERYLSIDGVNFASQDQTVAAP
jgi:C-terminal processing protease CtpA/Prc